jgi:glycosyltransferase involved in cell wall biosynthesis
MDENQPRERPLRVAMIIQSYFPRMGGAESQVMALAPLLKQKGADPHVFTRRYAGMPAYEVVKGTPVHRQLAPGSKPVAAFFYIFSTLLKFITFQPDMLHAHELLSPATIGVFAKKIFKRPLLVKVLRGGPLGDMDKINHGWLGKQRIRLLRSSVDGFLIISKEIKQELQQVDIPEEKLIDLPNGVDIKRFRPVPAAIKKDLRIQHNLPEGKLVVFSGRLAPEKRLDLLLQVWPDVVKQEPEANLIVLGTGEEADSLIQTAGEGIHFIGQVADVVPYLQAADLFVLPSNKEGLSNALLEAMAIGLPVVATAVGGTPEVVKHGVNGWLVAPDNRNALLQGLLHGLKNLGDAQIGIQARKTVEENYSLQSAADHLYGLYVDLCRQYKLNMER